MSSFKTQFKMFKSNWPFLKLCKSIDLLGLFFLEVPNISENAVYPHTTWSPGAETPAPAWLTPQPPGSQQVPGT